MMVLLVLLWCYNSGTAGVTAGVILVLLWWCYGGTMMGLLVLLWCCFGLTMVLPGCYC